MADIDIVPRRRSTTWLWIVLAIVAALIVWAWLANRNATPDRIGRLDAPAGQSPDVNRITNTV